MEAGKNKNVSCSVNDFIQDVGEVIHEAVEDTFDEIKDTIEDTLDDIKDTIEDLFRPKKQSHKSKLDVVAVISNPGRFKRRYQLFQEFCERMRKEPRVRLTTVELQQRGRPFQTNATIKLRTVSELWYKENLINIAVQHLPHDWEYVAWIDADVEFQNKRWVHETIERLQTNHIVQLFSHAVDLGYRNETLQVHTGFAYQYVNGETYRGGKYGLFWHPGYAWACRRSAYDAIGGLLEFAILGSADTHMALAFIGLVERSLNHQLHKNYKELCRIFQERCEKHIKRRIGYVHGTLLHHFHSDKKNRKYCERWKILTDNKFDPLRDIKKDSNNVWQLEDDRIELRDQIKRYFRQRNEDSIDHNQEYPFVKQGWI